MKVFAFELSMPNASSWNGRWTGSDNLYIKFKSFTNKEAENLKFDEGDYYYSFEDGWGANVNVKIVNSKQKQKLIRRSDGFAGYDWMIDSIVKNGAILS